MAFSLDSRSSLNSGSSVIAHRTARLLGNSSGQVERRLKLAYECRNDLVHDDKVANKKLNQIGTSFERFVSQIEGDLRSSMAKHIELMNNGRSKKTILRQLGLPKIHKSGIRKSRP